MKILVTGGAGFIGSNLANILVDSNHLRRFAGETNKHIEQVNTKDIGDEIRVIALDDLSLGSPSNLSKKVKLVQGSVMDYDLLLKITEDCDFIFHQAAFSSSPMFADDPRRGVEVNVIGFMNVMESAKRNRVKKVIYASSSSLYNGLPTPYKESATVTPKTFYESSFYCREMLARTYNLEFGLNSVGLRYFSVYGPNEKHKGRFANNISQFIWDMAEKKKSPVIYGDGSQTRDFTFVEDVVQANILAMNANNNTGGFSIYNVGAGTQTSFNRVIEIINKNLGTDIKPTYIKNPINHYVQNTMADLSLARSELGFEPRWKNVEEGIKMLV